MWLEWMGVMVLQPLVGVEAVLLFAPQHACQSLAHHCGRLRGGVGWGERAIEGVGLTSARRHELVKFASECLPLVWRLGIGASWRLSGQAQPDDTFFSCAYAQLVMSRNLCAALFRIYS